MANYYTYNVKAGVAMPVNVQGKLILVDSIGAASGIDITPVLNSSNGRTMPGRRKGFKCWTDFDSLILESAVDTQVALFLSTTDVSIGFTEGAQVNVAGGVAITNDAGSRVPVDIAGGTVTVNAVNVGINNNDAAAVPFRAQALATIVNIGSVAVGVAATDLVNDPSLRKLRIRNAHASAVVGLGAAGVTLATAAVVLQPGDVWEEASAAGAHWYAVSDTAATPVVLQGLKP
jgi:hypothetical protein